MVNGQNNNDGIVANYPAVGHEYPVNNCNPSRPTVNKRGGKGLRRQAPRNLLRKSRGREHFAHQFEIQRRRWCIEQNDRRTHRQCAGDSNTLLLTTGQ